MGFFENLGVKEGNRWDDRGGNRVRRNVFVYSRSFCVVGETVRKSWGREQRPAGTTSFGGKGAEGWNTRVGSDSGQEHTRFISAAGKEAGYPAAEPRG